MTDSYESGYQDGRFDGYAEAMDMPQREYEELSAWTSSVLDDVMFLLEKMSKWSGVSLSELDQEYDGRVASIRKLREFVG